MTSKLFVSDGKIRRDGDAWVSAHSTAEAAENISEPRITMKQGSFGKSKTLLMESMFMVHAEGLPVGTYEYYLCDQGKLQMVWEGGDDGSAAMDDFILNDVDGDNIDEIIQKSPDAKTKQVFAWSPKSKRFQEKKFSGRSGK
jgi:hypothetical protein